MEKNIIERFVELVVVELKKALAERRQEQEDANAANVSFNIKAVLDYLGAKGVAIQTDVQKDYTWLRVKVADKNGFDYPIDFSQRRQATRAEVEGMKDLSGNNVYFDEAKCTAGIYDDGESIRYSMKWDAVINGGEVIAFSGPVRKWNDETGAYDGPVAE